MSVKTLLNNTGLIEILFQGEQTAEELEKIITDFDGLSEAARAKNGKVLVICDFTNMGKTNMAARQKAVEVMKSLSFDKMAGFGANQLFRFISNSISRFSGKLDKTRHFKTRANALAWLNSQ